jgi:hypothetical protein
MKTTETGEHWDESPAGAGPYSGQPAPSQPVYEGSGTLDSNVPKTTPSTLHRQKKRARSEFMKASVVSVAPNLDAQRNWDSRVCSDWPNPLRLFVGVGDGTTDPVSRNLHSTSDAARSKGQLNRSPKFIRE